MPDVQRHSATRKQEIICIKESTPCRLCFSITVIFLLCSGGGGSKGQVDRPEALSEEEWAKIQQLVGLDEPGAADLAARYGQEALNMLQVELDVTFRRSQVRLLGRAEDDEVLRLGSEGFLVGAKVYPQMKVVRVGLERYGVHVPEGRLLQVGGSITVCVLLFATLRNRERLYSLRSAFVRVLGLKSQCRRVKSTESMENLDVAFSDS